MKREGENKEAWKKRISENLNTDYYFVHVFGKKYSRLFNKRSRNKGGDNVKKEGRRK